MDERILNLLNKHHIAAFSTVLSNGSLHSAALHFSHSEEPFTLYFSTDRNSRKCEGLLNGEVVKAAVVIGLSEEEWVTLQLDGEVHIITEPQALDIAQKTHYTKHPGSAKYKDDPDTVFLSFTPTWWRFSDFNTKPATFLSTE